MSAAGEAKAGTARRRAIAHVADTLAPGWHLRRTEATA
jgi:hypothetical protein